MIDLTIKNLEKRVEAEVLNVTGKEMAQEIEKGNTVLHYQAIPVVHHLQIHIKKIFL